MSSTCCRAALAARTRTRPAWSSSCWCTKAGCASVPEHDPVELGPGDFVAFDGSVAHVYEALGERVTATLVMTSPA